MSDELKCIGLASLIALTAAAQPPSAQTVRLQKRLQEMAARHRGKVALYATDLKTGEAVQLDPDRVVQTASVIKLLIFVEAFHQIKDGKKSFADPVVFRPDDRVIGSGILQYLHAPLALTLEDALVLMMIESDNTATNLVIDQVGLASVNARGARLGLTHTWLYKKVYKPSEGPVPADQKIYGLGKTTAREMASLMAGIDRCEVGDEKPIVISAFTYDNKDQRWIFENEGELLIARMARRIVQAWSPGGVVGEKK